MMAEPPTGWASDWKDETGTYIYNEQNNLHSHYVDGKFQGFYDSGQIGLSEVNIIVPSSDSLGFLDLPEYIEKAYDNSYDPRFYPYNPDAFSLNIGASGNGIFAHADFSASLIFAPEEIAFSVTFSGGIGYSGWKPSIGAYGSISAHDIYNNTNQDSPTDVVKGIGGNSMTSGALGPLSYSHGRTSEKNGIIQPVGVMSNTIGLGSLGLGISQQVSQTKVFRPFK